MAQLNKLLNTLATRKEIHFPLFLVVLLFLSLFMMYSYSPLHPGQDFFFHYRRLQALMDGLVDNPFLIYLDYSAIDGYGYFAKAFYPDVLLVPFAWIGNYIGIESAYLLMIFTYTVLCGIFTYKMVMVIYKNSYVAATSAILYTFCVYRLLDIYHRAAIGESISFTFLPIVFLGLYHIIKGNYKKWYILTIGFSLMIFTHLISSVLMFVTVVIFLCIYNKSWRDEPRRIKYLFLSGLVTLPIVAYFLLPMIEQMLSADFYYHSRQIMSKVEDTTYGIHKIIWGMFTGIVHPKQIFIAGVGFLLTGVIGSRLFVYGKSAQLRSLDIAVVVGLIYIFACSSLFPWSIYPFKLLNFIQLPWRLFEFSSFFFAVAGAYYLSLLVKNRLRALIVFASVIALTCLTILSDGRLYSDVRGERPITMEANYLNTYNLGGMEYVPNKVPSAEFIAKRGNKIIVTNKETTVDNISRSNNLTSFDVKIKGYETLELPLIFYKGYTAKSDNPEIEVSASTHGLVQISVDKPGHVEVYYAGTVMQKISWFISVISVLLLCIYIYWYNRKRKMTA